MWHHRRNLLESSTCANRSSQTNTEAQNLLRLAIKWTKPSNQAQFLLQFSFCFYWEFTAFSSDSSRKVLPASLQSAWLCSPLPELINLLKRPVRRLSFKGDKDRRSSDLKALGTPRLFFYSKAVWSALDLWNCLEYKYKWMFSKLIMSCRHKNSQIHLLQSAGGWSIERHDGLQQKLFVLE